VLIGPERNGTYKWADNRKLVQLALYLALIFYYIKFLSFLLDGRKIIQNTEAYEAALSWEACMLN
jgi:hypothetical protein